MLAQLQDQMTSPRARSRLGAVCAAAAGALLTLGGCVSVPARGDASVFAQGHAGSTGAAVFPGDAVHRAMHERAPLETAPGRASAVLGGLGQMSRAEAWAMNSRRDESLGVPGAHQAAGVWPQLRGATLESPRRVQFNRGADTATVFRRAPGARRGVIHPRIY